MTERVIPTAALSSLTPEQFLAQFTDDPDHGSTGATGRRRDEVGGFDPIEGDDRDGGEAWSGGDDRPDGAEGRLDGDDIYSLSARFAVPETSSRPPLPPTPDAAGRDREIPPIPPRSMLQLSNDPPADC